MSNDVEMRSESNESDWIRVTSTDGYSFLIKKKVANVSGTMKSMLDAGSNYSEAITKTCPVMQRGIIVEKLVEYMAFRAHYEPTALKKEDVPIHEFLERLPPEIVLELLLAADYHEL